MYERQKNETIYCDQIILTSLNYYCALFNLFFILSNKQLTYCDYNTTFEFLIILPFGILQHFYSRAVALKLKIKEIKVVKAPI